MSRKFRKCRPPPSGGVSRDDVGIRHRQPPRQSDAKVLVVVDEILPEIALLQPERSIRAECRRS